MSETPQTDALREAIDNGAATEAEMTSLAGKLERERAELCEDQSNQEDILLRYMDEVEKSRTERDEARELFQTAMELLKKYKDVSKEARDALFVATAERNEAREAFAMATDQCVVAQAKLREGLAK
jgi:hypothetical protein